MKTQINDDNLDDYLLGDKIEPPHPGILFDKLVVRRAGLAVTSVAAKTGISREMLHRLLRGKASLTARTAIGFAEIAGNTPEFWLRAQNIHDIWHERKKRGEEPKCG